LIEKHRPKTSAQKHLLKNICSKTSAQKHLLKNICSKTSAQKHLLKNIIENISLARTSMGEVANEAGCGACESTTALTTSPAWRLPFGLSPSVVFELRQYVCERLCSRYGPSS
jgi:hypothetical protein